MLKSQINILKIIMTMNENMLQVKQNLFCKHIFGNDALLKSEYDPSTGTETAANVCWIDEITTGPSTDKPVLTLNNSGNTLLIDVPSNCAYKYVVIDITNMDFLKIGTLMRDTSNNVINTVSAAEKINPIILIVPKSSNTSDVIVHIYAESSIPEYYSNIIFYAAGNFFVMAGCVFKMIGNSKINIIKPFEFEKNMVKGDYHKIYRNSIVEFDSPVCFMNETTSATAQCPFMLLPNQKIFFSNTSSSAFYNSNKGIYDYTKNGQTSTYRTYFQVLNTRYKLFNIQKNIPYVIFTPGISIAVDTSIHVYGDEYFDATQPELKFLPPSIVPNVLYEVTPILFNNKRISAAAYAEQTYYLKPTVKI